ncbi:MAG: hypothetical protein QNI99_19215 [Woeseiaceae bacterium]|nr:hypothetical protein [Woeseiaceae bacterium]
MRAIESDSLLMTHNRPLVLLWQIRIKSSFHLARSFSEQGLQMSSLIARRSQLLISAIIAIVGSAPQPSLASDDARFPRVSMAMQCRMGGDEECLRLCGSPEDYDQDACVAAFNKFRNSMPEPEITETETETADSTADAELGEQLEFYEKECMRHTASVSDLLNSANPDEPQRENSLRTHYYYAKDENNPLAERKEAMQTALQICESMRNVQGG